MRNLLAAACLRMRKNKVFLVGMALLFFSAVSGRINQYVEREKYGFESLIENGLMEFALLGVVLLSVFVSLFLGTEYSDGTIRNKIIIGHERGKIYGASLIAAILAGWIFAAAYLLPSLVVGFALQSKVEMEAGTILLFLAASFVLIVVFAALYTLVCMLCASKAGASVICVLGVFLLLFAGTFIRSRLNEPEYYQDYVFHAESGEGEFVEDEGALEPNPLYLRGVKRKVYEFLNDFLPGGQLLQISCMEAPHAGQLMVYSLFIIVVSTGGGLYCFRKKNLK